MYEKVFVAGVHVPLLLHVGRELQEPELVRGDGPALPAGHVGSDRGPGGHAVGLDVGGEAAHGRRHGAGQGGLFHAGRGGAEAEGGLSEGLDTANCKRINKYVIEYLRLLMLTYSWAICWRPGCQKVLP